MSSNAGTWFYSTPEHDAFMVTERLNASFWQARMVEATWRCVQAEEGAPFRAYGYAGDLVLEMEWIPGDWLSLRMPAQFDVEGYVDGVTSRILAIKPSAIYEDRNGRVAYEWYTELNSPRWKVLQGNAEYIKLRRLAG